MKRSKDLGRIEWTFTIKTDVTVMREFYAMLADLPMAVEKRLPLWKRAIEAIAKFFDEL